jgi:Ran GTPase-activating protein (RanGAP) involved in mRNA processing and transport
MNFEWQLFDFTKRDCQVLSKCISECHALRSLHLNRSKLDDEKIRLFISQILDHPSLIELDLSHNLISDRGCRALGKFINGKHSQLETLNLCNNLIRSQGAQALAHALVKNTKIKTLDLRLNRLGDEGGQAIGN